MNAKDMPDPADTPALGILSETRAALLVVDMQVDFCAADGYVAARGLDTTPCRTIVPALQDLIDTARTADVPVIWVFANYDDALVPPTHLRRKRQMGIKRNCCIPGTEGYKPFGVEPAEGEPQFVKHSYTAFTNPDFEAHLRAEGIETLIFTGVQTNVCVEATLREAFNRGFHVVVAEECVASHTPALHEGTLANVRAIFGEVGGVDQIKEILRRNAAAAGSGSKPVASSTDRPPETEGDRT